MRAFVFFLSDVRDDPDILSVDDIWGEDRNIFKPKRNHNRAPHNKALPSASYIVGGYQNEESDEYKLGDFTFHALLVKVRVEENKVKTRIFQYAMRDEKIENDEAIFNKVNKQFKSYGKFIDASNGTSSSNMYYTKNNQCKFPFIVAIKLECHDNIPKDGYIISKFVSKRMQDTLDPMDNIKGFKYEPLLEDVIKDIRTRNIDISNIRVSENASKGKGKGKNKGKSKFGKSNRKPKLVMKSKNKIIPIPSMMGSSSVPSYSRTQDRDESSGQHSPIHPPSNHIQMSPVHKKNISNTSVASSASAASSVYFQPGKRGSRSPFGVKNKPLPLNTPQRSPFGSNASSITSKRSSPFGSKPGSKLGRGSSTNTNTNMNWAPVQTANHIKMSHLR